MSLVKFEDLPKEAQEQFRKMREDGKRLAEIQDSVTKAALPQKKEKPFYPPLVKKIEPRTPEVRINEPGGQPSRIQLISGRGTTNPAPVVQRKFMGDVITFSNFQAFYDLLAKHPSLYTDKEEITSFVSFVESIPKQCGCVRGTLNERAKDMYGKVLPIIQAKYPEVFSQIKTIVNLQKIIFTDDTLLLLEV